jgi:tetratricopeptide (TPR) repeat protein
VSGGRRAATTAAIFALIWTTHPAAAQTARRLPAPGSNPVLLMGRMPAVSQREHEPLTPDQVAMLRKAQAERARGRPREARRTLDALLAQAPHHPLVLGEIAQLMLAESDFAGLERLARRERYAQKDSLILGHELTLACERLGFVKQAAQIAAEVWACSPQEGDWTSVTIERLHAADPEGVVQAMRAAFKARPQRVDLARTLARLEWQQGDVGRMLDVLRTADHNGQRPPMRWDFADGLLRTGNARDSTAALAALVDVAGDAGVDRGYRTPAARRAWAMFESRGETTEGARRITEALRDLPPEQWDAGFVVEIARALREGGRTGDARKLMAPFEDRAAMVPELAIERALVELRDGPPARAFDALEAASVSSQDGRFYLGEARFFAGEIDSALASYKRVAADPRGPHAGEALERIYLIEDAKPVDALPAFGRMAYAEWRGEQKQALALSDSLYHGLPRGELWSQAALIFASHLETAGNREAALEPLLAVADSMPEARLASRARQRAGDLYLTLGHQAEALHQYEECLARYPRAWNAPEVRRQLQTLRRERRL